MLECSNVVRAPMQGKRAKRGLRATQSEVAPRRRPMRRVRANEVGALTMFPPDRVWRVDARAEAAARCDEERKSADEHAPPEGTRVFRSRGQEAARW